MEKKTPKKIPQVWLSVGPDPSVWDDVAAGAEVRLGVVYMVVASMNSD
jgi:hypothetical protein